MIKHGFDTATLITQSAERSDYREGALYDMEAWGFINSVTRFSSLELCHCLKIISDNADTPLTRDKARISALIAAQVESISTFADHLLAIAQPMQDAQALEQLLEQIKTATHVTVSEQVQLRKLLPVVLASHDRPQQLLEELTGLGSSRRIIEYLRMESNRIGSAL